MPKEQTSGKPTTSRYSSEEKAVAVRTVRTLRGELGTDHGTVQRVATQLGYGIESVRTWVKQADIDDGHVAGVTAELVGLGEANYCVYGVRKLPKCARRAGIDIGRDQTGRLMRAAGIEGATRSKRVKTTKPDPAAARHPDLVNLEFTVTAPNRLWVTDLTFVPTWAGVAYVCFIIDVFSRMIVGWRCASHMRTEMVLDGIEMARWARGTHHADLRCRSDAGSQFTSIRYGERLAEISATPSIGTVGDSYDNALAESVNGYYWTELIRGPARPGPWRTVEDLELATLGRVHWHNTQRLDGYLGDIPPAEFEQTFYAVQTGHDQLAGIK